MKSGKKGSKTLQKGDDKMKVKSRSHVKLDHFLDINCDYVDSNQVNEEFFQDDSKLTIFQNNIRSLNKNFHLVEELFARSKHIPDILAFCETKLHENSLIPPFDGYAFERVDSPTNSGGVGVFLSNRIKYSIRADLNQILSALT